MDSDILRACEERSQASAPASAPPPSRPAAPAQPTAKANNDDCGWLLRAVANKKKKKSTAPSVGWTSAAPAAAPSKKRPLEAKPRPAAAPAPATKLPRGVGWSQPSKAKAAPKASGARTTFDAPTAPPGESFDEVFAEIYGASKRVKRTVETAVENDDDTLSLPLASKLFLPDNSAVDAQIPSASKAPVVSAAARRVQPPPSSDHDKWDFAAPSAIELDAFETPGKAPTKDDDHQQRMDDAAFERWKDEQSSRAVSDNFVRLNMRKRFKGSSGKAKKLPAYLRSRGFADTDESATQSTSKPEETTTSGGGGGLLDDGIDFIEECLEMLKRHEEKGQASSAVTAVTSEPPVVEPPRCQHALVCQRVLVKKKNKNHGRAFFSCPLGYDEGRCDYFLWEDNHSQFALHRLFGASGADNGDPDHPLEDDPTSNYIPLDLSKPMAKQTKALVTNLRVVFGHAEFRPGQQWAIERVFEKKRTLLVLPTGAGKSLCYQYPALFLPGITIVISPLISLMNDQFHNLPPVLKKQATCVTTSSSSKTLYAEFVRNLLGGKLKLLFVSPEKALASGFQRLLMQMQSRISLVCVDEAHCISEWSHHFRPSYLRLASIFALADSVLAITATASRRVERDILSQLANASDENEASETEDQTHKSVLRMPWQRDNLQLRVVRVASDEDRLEKLCNVLTKTAVSGATIMYIHQQWQAETMANLLQERLVADSDNSKTKWSKHKIAAYHAKMDPEVKEKVRLGFLSGRVKLVIATIAFGMGIDKQNVRLVIHYHVPSSIEHYLQQVGRAGRDGKAASALLFLLDDDVRAFRSLLFSNALHISQVRKLVELVTRSSCDAASQAFRQQSMAVVDHSNAALARRSRVWMHVASLEQYLDMKSATIETFLALMSLQPLIQSDMRLLIHPTAMSWCVLSMMETQLTNPKTDALLKRLVASVMDNDASSSLGHVEIEADGYLRQLRVYFHVASVAQTLLNIEGASRVDTLEDPRIDVQSRRLMHHLRTWQANGIVRKFQMEKSAFDLDVEWSESRQSDTTDQDRRRLCAETWTKLLYDRHNALEAMEIKRLRHLYSALSAAAAPMPSSLSSSKWLQGDSDCDVDDDNEPQAEAGILEQKLSTYFDETQESGDEEHDDQVASWRALTSPLTPDLVEAIERDIEALTSRPPDAFEAEDPGSSSGTGANSMEWHGYNVARIFHGLASPCFPSKQWRDKLSWRKYNHVAFEKLVMIADKVLANAHLK